MIRGTARKGPRRRTARKGVRRRASKNIPLRLKTIRLTLEYDGTRFNGWQSQHPLQRSGGGRVRTVQAELEKALGSVFGRDIRVIASSRTDSGVHARGQAAGFRVRTGLEPEAVKAALNRHLPRDIAVSEACEAAAGFDARRCALSKLYRYTIWNSSSRSPILDRYSFHCKYPLDISRMKLASGPLAGRHDFAPFESSSGARVSTIRTVKKISVSRKGDIITIDIEADGFLYNMARNIAGLMIEAGKGRLDPGAVKVFMRNSTRRSDKRAALKWQTAPGRGLCLVKVRYGKK